MEKKVLTKEEKMKLLKRRFYEFLFVGVVCGIGGYVTSKFGLNISMGFLVLGFISVAQGVFYAYKAFKLNKQEE